MSCSDLTNFKTWSENECLKYWTTASQQQWDELFNQYFPDGVPNQFNPQQDLIIELCRIGSNGAKCRSSLLKLCKSFSADDMINPNYRRMCGCYLDTVNYSTDIPRVCQKLCSASGNIPYFSSDAQLNPSSCVGNYCIIDRVSLNITNSQIGDISFQQACPYCPSGTACFCVVNDVDYVITNSSVGRLSISENCAGQSICNKTINGVPTEVDCQEYFGPYGSNLSTYQRSRIFYYNTLWIAGFALLVLIIAFMTFSILWKRQNKQLIKDNAVSQSSLSGNQFSSSKGK